jgi:hypothetical protein
LLHLYLLGTLGFSPTKAGLAFVPMALFVVHRRRGQPPHPQPAVTARPPATAAAGATSSALGDMRKGK